ncbi:MAG: hypothetical protein M1831_004387 [Alyxoria varia]|nr:MAG: hypothetical protein M1831_004387 [Alyxoria varia]
MNGTAEEVDLYEVLGVGRGCSKAEIKKAYHKSALSSHPDKVAPEEREDAEIRFKAVSRAYEILHDDDSRHLYDTHGMAAFEKGGGPGAGEPDINDILSQMFGGMNMGEEVPGSGAGRRGPKKGRNEEQEYEVTLEELYKGKATKFSSTKNVICSHCNGKGGREKARPKNCESCKGSGTTVKLQPVGPGLVTRVAANCPICSGAGKFFREKDRCRRCKGARVIQQKKLLELYIPPGSRQGEHIVLPGEADQHPDQEPGDIVFELVETPHEVFDRAGADLKADLHITLAEALTGFNRVVLTHLDGRGIALNVPSGQVLTPDQVLKVPNEGMPIKRSDARGALYFAVKIEFPKDNWLAVTGDTERSAQQLRNILPKAQSAELKQKTANVAKYEEVDEVDFVKNSNLEDFGAGSGDPRAGGGWEDDEDEDMPQAQCAQQ